MASRKGLSKKQQITWEQFKAFTKAADRDLSHAFRVFRGERTSEALSADFQEHFGFPMDRAELAGRRKVEAA